MFNNITCNWCGDSLAYRETKEYRHENICIACAVNAIVHRDKLIKNLKLEIEKLKRDSAPPSAPKPNRSIYK